jgi:hypothetical protein
LFAALIPINLMLLFLNTKLLVATIPLAVIVGYPVFKDTVNLVQGVGPIYWVTRNNHVGLSFGFGIMRETDFPWRYGKGIQIGFGKYLFQFGICRKQNVIDEMSNLLTAIKGRNLLHKPAELREWT